MTRRLAFQAAMCLALAVIPYPAKTESTNNDIDKRVDEITSSPDYDWLRSHDAAEPDVKIHPGHTPPPSKKQRPLGEKGDPGCGYEPSEQPPSSPEDNPPPQDTSPGNCGGGAGPKPQSGSHEASCDCGPALQSCACSRALGACNCSVPGSFGAALGYLFGGLLLALLIFFVAWIIARREHTSEDTIAGSLVEDTDPEEVRLSHLPQTPFEQMMRHAESAARRGDFKTAVGWCYLGGIGALHRAGVIDLRRSTTNLEIVESVRKKQGPYRQTARLVRIFEDIYFGDRQPTEAHWLESRKIARQDIA